MDALIAAVLDPKADLADRHRAFAEIVARFQDMAFACAYAILKDYYLAEDAAQEAFITAWQKLDQLKDPAAFPGWFKRIVFSQCHRLTRGERLLVFPLAAGSRVPASSPDPQALAERMELSEKVLAAIRALPDGERLVTTLFYIDGYSQHDIGDFLELQATTVAKRLFSARRRLKQGLIRLLKEDLQQHKPSRRGNFAEQVQARLRPLAESDWKSVFSMARAADGDGDHWLRLRQQFDESRLIRRHHVAQHAVTAQVLGYGAIEQTIFLPKYQLLFVVAPEHLRGGVGDLLLDQLMKDLREVNAIAVWHRSDARLTEALEFLKARGFVETSVAREWRLSVADFDAAPFESVAARAARHAAIVTYTEARAGDPACLRKLHELLNAVLADEPGRQPFAPVPIETVERWFSARSLLPDACFIASADDRYVGITSLTLGAEEIAGGITQGFTGILGEYRRCGLATALKLRAIEYARRHGYAFIRAFSHHLNLPAMALNEKLGFHERLIHTTLEKCLREVKALDPAIYDDYVGRYGFDAEQLEKYQWPARLTINVKKVGARLISEIGDMQDELFPETENRFFIKMHYGEIEFIRDAQHRVIGLSYCEAGRIVSAARIE